MSKNPKIVCLNLRHARDAWGKLPKTKLNELKALTRRYSLCVALGDVQLLDEHWHITYAGLLRLAERRRCAGIRVQQVPKFCDPGADRWVFKATVYKDSSSRGFVGHGDADPSNTSPLVRGAEMRVAETRAVNRALRKAYGIGLCSVEELGWRRGSRRSTKDDVQPVKPAQQNGSGNGQPKLRDRLCVLIRQHNLDPTLVKAYAADFCGVTTLREASRDVVESFVSHLARFARANRDALICKLNSYAQPPEVKV